MHARIDVNPHILRMLEGTFPPDAVHIILKGIDTFGRFLRSLQGKLV